MAEPQTTPLPTTQAQATSDANSAAKVAAKEYAQDTPEYAAQLITAYQNSVLYAPSSFPRYNPDILVTRRGLEIYDDMMVDEQVKAVYTFRRDAVTARKWSLRYEESSTLAEAERERRVTLLTKILDQIDGSLTDAFNAILKAMRYGYSLTEKVFDWRDIEGRAQYCITQMQSKPLKTFYFECDQYGRIKGFYQLIGSTKNYLDLRKFVYYVHNPDEDNVYGRSELRAAYRSWYSKDVILRLWNLWMERMAGGFLAVTRDAASAAVVPGTPDYAALQAALSSITTTTSMLLPSGFNIQLISPNNTDQYEAALSWHDRAIAKSQLVPNLLGVSDQGAHGALAQSVTQLEAFAWTLANISQRLADCVNTQIIAELSFRNFGDYDAPKFAFSAVTDAQLQWIISSWKDLVGAKSLHVTPEDESHIRKILDFPGISPEDIQALDDKAKQDQIDIAQASKPMQQGKSGQNFTFNPDEPRDEHGMWTATLDALSSGEGKINPPGKVDDSGEGLDAPRYVADGSVGKVQNIDVRAPHSQFDLQLDRARVEHYLKQKDLTPISLIKRNGRLHVWDGNHRLAAAIIRGDKTIKAVVHVASKAAQYSRHTHREPRIVSRAAFSRALMRVDFAVIDNLAEKISDNAHATVAGSMAKMLSKVLTEERVADKEHISQFGFDAIDVAKLKAACRQTLTDAWTLGTNEATREMSRARKTRMARKVTSTLDLATAYLDNNAFRMAGNLSDGARSIIQQELLNAIKGDKSFSDTREAILDRLIRKGFTDLKSVGEVFPEDVHQALSKALGGEGYTGSDAAYIDTLIRTNVFDSMNQARLESFRDPDLGDFVQALEYASVLDDHTTEICAELNGSTWSRDNPLWDTYMPPNHYNCRSVVIPITQVDGWDGAESPDPTVEPQEGFK